MRKLLILLLLLAPLVQAYEANMYIFAVADHTGVPAVLTVDVSPGDGEISLDVGNVLVGEGTQESIRNAVKVATEYLDVNMEKYNYHVRIETTAERVDGPSAGIAMALAVYAALQGEDVPDDVSASGTISSDGYVGPVGGLCYKIEAAADVGVKTFLIPYGERNVACMVEEEVAPGITQVVEKTVDIVEYAKKEWGVNVYEVRTFADAVSIVFEGRKPEINVERTTEELPNFVPPPAEVRHSLPFRGLAEKLVKRAWETIKEAKTCSLVLRDAEAKEYLQNALRTAEEMVGQAEKLLDRNYFYTAANYAFLAIIDARMYRDVCEHPSLLLPNSLAFQTLLQDAESRVAEAEDLANSFALTKENYALVAGARDRIVRAKYTLYGVKEGQSAGLGAVYDIISADEWARAAEDMLGIASNEGSKLFQTEKLAREVLMSAQDTLAMLENLPEDVRRRVDWAMEAYQKGWYVAAAMEAVSARGLALAEILGRKGDVLNTLKKELNADVVDLWDELYLNHARYYYYAAQFYKSQGRAEKAEEMAKTGLQIAEMARELSRLFAQIEAAPVVVVQKKEVQGKPWAILALAVAILALSMVFILLAGRKRRRVDKERVERYMRRLEEVEKKIALLERKKRKTEKDRKELMKLRRLRGRYRKLLESLSR